MENKSKYKDLEVEIQSKWHMRTVVIPLVVDALGKVKKGMLEKIKKVSEAATLTEIQKISMLVLRIRNRKQTPPLPPLNVFVLTQCTMGNNKARGSL